jgi:putative endonuclease
MASGYYVYVLSSDTGVLYLGAMNDLHRGLEEHRRELVAAFSQRYRTTRLVYFEETPDIRSAIARERQLKGWRRSKKLSLIRSTNPGFHDLREEWWGSSAGAQGPADDIKDSSALRAFAEHPVGRSDMGREASPPHVIKDFRNFFASWT